MPSTYRQNSDWVSFGLVFAIAASLIILDAKSNWLDKPRSVLSVVVSPVQTVATFPNILSRAVGDMLSPEPNIEIAHQNLRNEYFQLKAETLLLRSLKEENESLRKLLDASERLPEKVILSELVNVSVDPYSHHILVDKGSLHNVYVGQSVIDDKGVIGQVTEVMPFNSNVVLITDPGHALPVQVKRTGLRTIAYGTGDITLLNIPYLNQNSDISVGDVLYSSGLGGRFPSGYPVATISKVEEIQDEAFMQVTAKPIARLDRSNHVLLLSRTANRAETKD